ncbi:MAG: YunC family protein [Bacillota bacterium]
MVTLYPVDVGDVRATAITVELPKTSLLAVTTDRGYIMCGALDVHLLNTRLAERGIVAGRALGVRTIEQLLDAPLAEVTDAARALGILPGMSGREAIQRMK